MCRSHPLPKLCGAISLAAVVLAGPVGCDTGPNDAMTPPLADVPVDATGISG